MNKYKFGDKYRLQYAGDVIAAIYQEKRFIVVSFVMKIKSFQCINSVSLYALRGESYFVTNKSCNKFSFYLFNANICNTDTVR